MTKGQEQINPKLGKDIPLEPKKKRGRRPSDEPTFPIHSLKKSLRIIEAMEKNYAGDPTDPVDIADILGTTLNSSRFRNLLSSSHRYGLTNGSYKSKKIEMTPLGRSIVEYTSDEEKNHSLFEALRKPDVFNKILAKYDRREFPREQIIRNVLKNDFNVPYDRLDVCVKVITENVNDFNLIHEKTKMLRLSQLSPPDAVTDAVSDMTETSPNKKDEYAESETESIPESKQEEKPKQIFVAHGKNRKPLEQLKGILDQFNVQYKVAIDEANQGRPVSQKVSELMQECSSAIFLFTKDEETKDLEGNTVYRPSDNVVYELGAASVLYGKKIVIFKQDGVSFGSDFKDLGYISFDDNKLDAKAIDLMKELIGFGILKISAT